MGKPSWACLSHRSLEGRTRVQQIIIGYFVAPISALIHQRSILSDSLVAEADVQKLREKIAQIESSIVPPTEKCMIERNIATMQESVTRVHQLKEKIAKLEKGKKCKQADFEELERELNAIQTIFRKHLPGNLTNTIAHSERVKFGKVRLGYIFCPQR